MLALICKLLKRRTAASLCVTALSASERALELAAFSLRWKLTVGSERTSRLQAARPSALVREQRAYAGPFLGAVKEKADIVHGDGNLAQVCYLHAEANVLRRTAVWDCMRRNDP
jgi:hypothetical protein